MQQPIFPIISLSLGFSKKAEASKASRVEVNTFPQFFELPAELKFYILSFLNETDMCSVAKSTRALRQMAQEDMIWRDLCKKSGWEVPRETVSSLFDFDYKKYFSEKVTISRKRSLSWNLSPKVAGAPPTKRFKHTATAFGKYIIFIGGQETDTKRFNEIIYFDTQTQAFFRPIIKGDVPPNFSRHVAVLVKGRIFVFGGFDGFGTNFELAIFNPATFAWTNVDRSQVRGELPPPRTNHSAAAVDNMLYLFGGNNNNSATGQYQVLDDFYSLDTDSLTWTNLSQSTRNSFYPHARSGHALSSINNKIFLFGGGVWNETQGWVQKSTDIHIFDPSTQSWSQPQCTGKIETSTFVISFTIGNFLFIFGGGSKPKHCVTNDLYVLDTLSFTWSSPEFDDKDKPQPRDMGTATAVGQNVYLMGGYAGGAVSYFDKLTVDAKPIFEKDSWVPIPIAGCGAR